MTKLRDDVIAKVRELPDEEQDALALAVLAMTEAEDAADIPLDEKTRAAIREGLAQAERGEFLAARQSKPSGSATGYES